VLCTVGFCSILYTVPNYLIMGNATINQAKYENAILYFVQHCNNQYLGATKLNKLLYYLDFLNYRDRGKSVTGDEYYHMQYGPIPSSVETVMSALCESEKIKVTGEPFKETMRKIYKAEEKPDVTVFSKEEQELLVAICKEFKECSIDTIVAQTHLEAPWFYSMPHDKIDYEYAHSIEVLDGDEDDYFS